MNAVDLLERLADQGVLVALDGTDLRIRGSDKVITPELTDELRHLKSDLIELLTPKRDGTDLQQLAYEVRDARLVAECRGKAVELQTWLTGHLDEHMATEFGSPKWISTLAQFNCIERGRLRNVLHYDGCIHDGGSCPTEAPSNCCACEGDPVI
jgi:hypothetical protein